MSRLSLIRFSLFLARYLRTTRCIIIVARASDCISTSSTSSRTPIWLLYITMLGCAALPCALPTELPCTPVIELVRLSLPTCRAAAPPTLSSLLEFGLGSTLPGCSPRRDAGPVTSPANDREFFILNTAVAKALPPVAGVRGVGGGESEGRSPTEYLASACLATEERRLSCESCSLTSAAASLAPRCTVLAVFTPCLNFIRMQILWMRAFSSGYWSSRSLRSSRYSTRSSACVSVVML
mmetsp:Transcript_41831/g.133462  ORF Transcript_41831/g.133462 Transcript_41831/m.133462 type:complete len:238 (-) Transcript_41831:2004-2717(-)